MGVPTKTIIFSRVLVGGVAPRYGWGTSPTATVLDTVVQKKITAHDCFMLQMYVSNVLFVLTKRREIISKRLVQSYPGCYNWRYFVGIR